MVLSYRSVEGLTWVVLQLSSHYVKLSDNFMCFGGGHFQSFMC